MDADDLSTTGLAVFDQATQTANIWLDEIMVELGCDRELAWRVLVAVLRGLRDRLRIEVVAHLGSQLPLLVRASLYGGTPRGKPLDLRSRNQFLDDVSQRLADTQRVDVHQAVQVVFRTMSRHVTEGHVRKIRDSLSTELATMWPQGVPGPVEAMEDLTAGQSEDGTHSNTASDRVGHTGRRSRRSFLRSERGSSRQPTQAHQRSLP
jgi:uncharacterized protein (DUF2267 family)